MSNIYETEFQTYWGHADTLYTVYDWIMLLWELPQDDGTKWKNNVVKSVHLLKIRKKSSKVHRYSSSLQPQLIIIFHLLVKQWVKFVIILIIKEKIHTGKQDSL